MTDAAAIFGDGNGAVVAYDASTGAVRWRSYVLPNGDIVGADIVASNETVVANSSYEVIGLDVRTGVVKWHFQPPEDPAFPGEPGYLRASHLVADGENVYVPAWGASISAVDLQTGIVKWVWTPRRLSSDTASELFRSGSMGAAVAGDTLYATAWHNTTALGGNSEGLLFALDKSTGTELWHEVLVARGGGSVVWASPVLVGEMALVATLDGRLYGVSRTTHHQAWVFESREFTWATQSQPAAYGNIAYFDGGDDHLYAIRAADGSVVWSAPSTSAVRDLLATSRRVYVPNGDRMLIHDRLTGALVATAYVKGENQVMESAANVWHDQIFITTTSGAWSFREP